MTDQNAQQGHERPAPHYRHREHAPKSSRDWLTLLGLALLALVLLAKFVFVRHELLTPNALRSVGLLVDFALVGALVGLVALTRRPLWWGLLVDAVVSVMLFGALLYVGYNDQLPSVQMLGMAGQLGDVKASVADLLSPTQLLLVADFVVLAVMAAFAGRWNRKGKGLQVAATIAVVFCAVAVGWGASEIARIDGPVDSIEAARSRGLIGWTIGSGFRTSEAAAVKIDAANVRSVQDEIDAALGVDTSRTADAPKPGVAKGMNVIVVQFEALQADMIGRKVGGVEVTPNLNKLAGRSYHYDNVVSQAGSGLTADAEFVVSSSLYPPNAQPAAVVMADKVLPSLPRVLGKAGYKTATMHVNSIRFWNRVQMYPALGWQAYYDKSFYGLQDKVGMGTSDEVFYDKTMPILEEMQAAKRPFYAGLVTISSHHPFPALPASKNPMPVPADVDGTIAGHYVQNLHYADEAFGEFMDELEARGILEDTVVVVYGDHFGLKPSQSKESETKSVKSLLGENYSYLDAMRVPLIIHLPGQEDGVASDQLVAQADIAPTIAELLGVSLADRPVFGASVFRTRTDPIVPTTCLSPAGSFVTPEGEWRVGLGTKGAKIKKNDGGWAPFEDRYAPLFDRANKLRELSLSYTSSLPARPFAGKIGEGATLPPAGKKALEQREGSGSEQ